MARRRVVVSATGQHVSQVMPGRPSRALGARGQVLVPDRVAEACHHRTVLLGHDAAELLELEPDELALIALPILQLQGAVCWNNQNQASRADVRRAGVADRETLRRVSWRLGRQLGNGSSTRSCWRRIRARITLGTWPQTEPVQCPIPCSPSEVRSLSLLRRAQLDQPCPSVCFRYFGKFRR